MPRARTAFRSACFERSDAESGYSSLKRVVVVCVLELICILYGGGVVSCRVL